MDTFTEKAKWIGSGDHIIARTTGEKSPALQLRKTIVLKKTDRAECLICGLGCYVLYINGKRVGDDVLSPAFTAYDKRALFVRYDISGYLKEGENVIAVKLGDGFYNQTTNDTWGFCYATWRDKVKLLFELFIDGESVCISDESWTCSDRGGTMHTAIRTGEWYDARKEDGWTSAGYDDSGWNNACIVAPAGGKRCPQQLPPIRECESYPAVDMWKSEKGWVFDFGKNISGYACLKMSGKRGKTATIRYAEKLSGKEIDQSNISCYVFDTQDFSTDKYTFKGDGEECWKPEFVYHGFRYAELSGIENEPPMSALTAIFVHTDLRKKGNLKTSDELLNWIYEAGSRSFLSNFHGISEDCPHREKNGWTGDAAISCNYAVCNFDMKEAYKKWLQDICDSQRESGQLPGIAPTAGWGYNWGSGPAWDCALFFLPYALYAETGNTECFDIVYASAEKYLDYAKYYRQKGLVCFGLSDWCPPNLPDLKIMDNRLSDSCYYYAMQAIMGKMAELQSEKEKAEKYYVEALETKEAIRKAYVRDDGADNDGQGALAEVLYFRIVEGKAGERLAEKLAKTVTEDGYKAEVGILGMKALFNALSAYGYTDVAYMVATSEEYPSYGYWKKQGATTLWETWDGSGSQNHHMYADILDWIFRYIVGIKNAGIGYNKCVLQPYFYAEECSVAGETETPFGKLSFSWKKTKGEFSADICLPERTECLLKLPGKEPIKAENGKISFDIDE